MSKTETVETTDDIEMHRVRRLADRDDQLGRVVAALLEEGDQS